MESFQGCDNLNLPPFVFPARLTSSRLLQIWYLDCARTRNHFCYNINQKKKTSIVQRTEKTYEIPRHTSRWLEKNCITMARFVFSGSGGL
jgi:hypothetical protein